MIQGAEERWINFPEISASSALSAVKSFRVSLLNQRQGRIALFTLLYLSEGAPIGFIWWALPTILRTAGVGVPKITALTAMLVLPWVFKFLWAPLVDAMRTPRWGFRAWIISAQLAMGATLLPLIWLDPAGHFQWWGVLLLFHAIFAATQDVAIDAMAINLVPEHQRGTLNGCMQAGMLVGRSAVWRRRAARGLDRRNPVGHRGAWSRASGSRSSA